jgi:hypothetical protein
MNYGLYSNYINHYSILQISQNLHEFTVTSPNFCKVNDSGLFTARPWERVIASFLLLPFSFFVSCKSVSHLATSYITGSPWEWYTCTFSSKSYTCTSGFVEWYSYGSLYCSVHFCSLRSYERTVDSLLEYVLVKPIASST